MQRKTLQASFQKASDTNFDAEFIISSTGLDRDGDTFSASALKAVASQTSKLLALWQHKQDQPVGYWQNLSFSGNKLKASLKLSSTNLGNMIKQLLIDGVPLTASVGFGVTDYDTNDNGGLHFKEVDMYECSIVSTPANSDAQRIKGYAKQFGVKLDSLTPIEDESSQLAKEVRLHDVRDRAAVLLTKAENSLKKLTSRK